MNGTSSNPAVVRKMTSAPWRWSSALVATVVPTTRNSIASWATPLARSASAMPWTGAPGVEDVLANTRPPVASSSAMRSVNVPPVSMPILTPIEPLRWRSSLPPPCCVMQDFRRCRYCASSPCRGDLALGSERCRPDWRSPGLDSVCQSGSSQFDPEADYAAPTLHRSGKSRDTGLLLWIATLSHLQFSQLLVNQLFPR